MKLHFLCLICLLLCSCEPEWVFNPPYQSQWLIHNQTPSDLVLCMDFVYADDDGEKEGKNDYELLSNDKFWGICEGMYSEDTCFASLFRCNYDMPLRGRIYITTIDGGNILKEWAMGVDNGDHDIFNEEDWDYQERVDDRPKNYDILHREWTFTITDADIGVVE